MSVEAHIGFSIIYRSPDPVLNNAAFAILFAVAMWIESPVIDLLSTATAHCLGPEGYRRVRHFTLILMVWVSVVHIAFVTSPAYVWVLRAMHTPEAVLQTAREPLLYVSFWSALIGWRRFNQGVLIRARDTKFIGIGTMVRCLTLFTVGYSLLNFTSLSGLRIVAASLFCSVLVETTLIHFAARPVGHRLMLMPSEPNPPTLASVWKFHLPLALATLVSLTSPPLLNIGINQSNQPVPHLAAWQVATGVAWTLRSSTFAIPEMLLSLGSSEQAIAQLRQFTIRLGVVLTALMLVMVAGLDRVIFQSVFHLKPNVEEYAHRALMLLVYFPAVTIAGCYFRGRLMMKNLTAPRFYALIGNLIALLTVLGLGVQFRWEGTVMAPLALGAALIVETAIQAWFWMRVRSQDGSSERRADSAGA